MTRTVADYTLQPGDDMDWASCLSAAESGRECPRSDLNVSRETELKKPGLTAGCMLPHGAGMDLASSLFVTVLAQLQRACNEGVYDPAKCLISPVSLIWMVAAGRLTSAEQQQ